MATKTDKVNEKATAELLELKELYEVMVTEGLEVLELKSEDERIHLSRQKLPVVYANAPRLSHAPRHTAQAAVPVEPPSPSQESIKAPLAGVFYRSGAPSRPPFAKEGDIVDAGQTLCIIEAMKVMNEIKAEKRCRIVKITAENSRPVTVEQDLFWIEPA